MKKQTVFSLNDDKDKESLKKIINKKKKDDYEQPQELNVYAEKDAKHDLIAKCNQCVTLFFVDQDNQVCPICGEQDYTLIGKLTNKPVYDINISKRKIDE